MRIYRIAQDTEDKSSDQFDWHDKYEIFDFVMRRFDVNMARKIIRDSTPRPIGNMQLSGLVNLVKRPTTNEDGSMTMTMGMGIDWARIDSLEPNFDLSFPVIVADIKGQILPIDGWHRIAKAVDSGITVLPAVLLTKEETQKVMM